MMSKLEKHVFSSANIKTTALEPRSWLFFYTLFGMHHMENNLFVSEPIQQLCFHHLMFSLSYYQTSLLNFAAVTYILLWGRNF